MIRGWRGISVVLIASYKGQTQQIQPDLSEKTAGASFRET